MALNRNWHFAALFVMAASFATLLFCVVNGYVNDFDVALRRWALAQNTPKSVVIWEDISVMGSVAVISGATLIALGAFALVRNWRAFRGVAIAMGGAAVFDVSIKWLVHRPRPDEVYPLTMPVSFSFPSGHALFSFTLCLVIAALFNRQHQTGAGKAIWVFALILTALIGASRVFLGVHYATDVLGGYIIAAMWLTFLSTLDSAKPV
jgi:undecaprenyl-diphosphatase